MKKGLIRGIVCGVGQVTVWLMMAIAVVSLGLVVSQTFEQAKANEPDTKRYSVTLYSGGQAVEYWVVDQLPTVSDQTTHIQGGRIIIGGPVVIQPYKQRPPY
jgi:hypothetical protein